MMPIELQEPVNILHIVAGGAIGISFGAAHSYFLEGHRDSRWSNCALDGHRIPNSRVRIGCAASVGG